LTYTGKDLSEGMNDNQSINQYKSTLGQRRPKYPKGTARAPNSLKDRNVEA